MTDELRAGRALMQEPFDVTASMIVWEGGDEPSDYDGGKVLRRNGRVDYPTGPYAWKHDTRWPNADPYDIIAYTPKAPSKALAPGAAVGTDEFEREYLLLASYCGTDTPGCSNKTPCIDCLAMCNVFDGKGGAFLRELGPLYTHPAPVEPGAVDDLRHRLKMIVSHATGGASQDIDASVNEICVRISQARNLVWEGGVEHGLKQVASPVEPGADMVEKVAAIIRDYNPKPCGLEWPRNAARAAIAALATQPDTVKADAKLKAALQDIAGAEAIPNDAVAFVWCRDLARAALKAHTEQEGKG